MICTVLLLIIIIQPTMCNTSQSDFFDEHLSDVLRDIVEIENDDAAAAEFFGESKGTQESDSVAVFRKNAKRFYLSKFRAGRGVAHTGFGVGMRSTCTWERRCGRRRKSKSPQFAFDSRRVRTLTVFVFFSSDLWFWTTVCLKNVCVDEAFLLVCR